MNFGHEEFATLCRDGSDEGFEQALAFVAARFDKGYWAARGDAVRSLHLLATTQERRARIVALLCDGLEKALYRGASRGNRPGTDANVVGVAAAAVTLGRLGAREAEHLLREAFRVAASEAAHYELNKTAGPLGVALAAIDADVGTELAEALARYDRVWGSGPEHVNVLRYATWVCRSDHADALAWLLDEGRLDGRVWAAAAIADLHAEVCTAPLRARLPALDDQHARTAVAHALRRLASQQGRPKPGARMAFGLPLWHDLEPADEFPSLYTSLLDEVPDEARPGDDAAGAAILAQQLFELVVEGDLDALEPYLPRLPELAAARDNYDRSLVHEAVCQHYWEPHTLALALRVIQASAVVDTTDQAGNTPLHDAATRDPTLVEALLAKGARADTLNRRGLTPLAVAEERLASDPTHFPEAVRACIARLRREAGGG